jgi:hypothetical protein
MIEGMPKYWGESLTQYRIVHHKSKIKLYLLYYKEERTKSKQPSPYF